MINLCKKASLPVRLFCALSLTSLVASNAEAEKEELFTFKEPHMGTEFTLLVWAQQGQVDDLTLLSRQAFERVAELNQTCSDYLPESEINNLARAPVGIAFPLSPDLFEILTAGDELSRQTGGAFDLTAGPLIRLWRLSRKNRRLPTNDQITRAKARTGAHLLTLDSGNQSATKHAEGMLFDLGGIAKGYAADAALEILREGGFPRSLVAASGDIVAGDPPPGKPGWKIGIETLQVGQDRNDIATVTLANRAISTSGDTRQFLELDGIRYSHIVSTKTGLGLTERIGASVVAPDAVRSDCYATAVTLLGEKHGLQFIDNIREVDCRISALDDGQEVVITSDGFSQFQEKKVIQKSPVATP